MSELVNAFPTKQFFVRFLTRDIELSAAILDLLDNCVDGIIRSNKTKNNLDATKPYSGYYAKITANKTKFVIEDNCGGIPRDIAVNVAFRLGRPSDDELKSLNLRVDKLETVGVYGIGMKRAIFKMGRQALVTSVHNGEAYRVAITPEWLGSKSWELELEDISPKGHSPGTTIEITKLHTEIADKFTADTNFLENLHDAIAELFAVIIEKGFRVEVNDRPVSPVKLAFLLGESVIDGFRISPYVFRGKIKKVTVQVVVGFHRDPSASTERMEDSEIPQPSVRQAGWSVICNDRLVLYGDKSEMTGWGTKTVPFFHPQYNAIAGLVTLRSNDPELLPLNTSKRGIEVSFGVYIKVLDYMKEGVKRFINYTNKWKGRLKETAPQFKNARAVPAAELSNAIPTEDFKRVTGSRLADDTAVAEEYRPNLPIPPREVNTRVIRFAKPNEEIREVALDVLDDADAPPSSVGEACFDNALQMARRSKRRS